MRDSAVEWRDLLALTRREVFTELILPLPWLLIAIVAGQAGQRGVLVAATLVMFMVGLRITHNAFHCSLGVSRRAGDLVMFGLSVLLGGAMHAIRHTHLRHHHDCLGKDDVEGHIAHLGFFSAVLRSPIYPLQIHWVALRDGSRRQKRWISIELAAVGLLHAAIWLGDSSTLKLMALSLYFANLSAPMVGIWAVHRSCGTGQFNARTCRSPLLNALTVSMFNHLDHHLYPAVPTCHLPMLAKRLDAHWQGRVSPPHVLGWRPLAQGDLAAQVIRRLWTRCTPCAAAECHALGNERPARGGYFSCVRRFALVFYTWHEPIDCPVTDHLGPIPVRALQ